MKKNSINFTLLWVLKSLYFIFPSVLIFLIINPWFIYTLTSLKMIAVYCTALILFVHIYHPYDIKNYDSSKLISAQLIVQIFCYVILQFTLWVNDRNYLNLGQTTVFLLANFVFSLLYTLFLIKLKNKTIGLKRVVIVTSQNDNNGLLKQMNRLTSTFEIVSTIDESKGFDDIIQNSTDVDSIIVDEINQTIKDQLINYGFLNRKEIIIIPSIEDILIKNSYDANYIDSPFLVLSSFGPRLYERFIKRCIDLVGSLLLTILASPILLAVAIAIKLFDNGPILYSQERLTTNGKVFRVYKFRSMIVNAEQNGAQLAKENDSRITPVGKILRKYRLDELPQIFNILKGDMSFVGPRPERPSIAAEYEKELPQFKYRLNVKAGLTGYAQVFGRYNTTPKDKLKLDLMYISKYNLLLDFELLFKTIQILFEKESTEGF